MSIKISYLIFISLLVHLSVKGQLNQDLEVYQDGTKIVLRGTINQSILKSGEDAQVIIQYGIDQLNETGGALKIHRGTYPVKAPIMMANSVKLYGSGRSTIILVDESNPEGVGIIMKGLKGSVIQDLTIKASSLGTGQTGVIMDDCGDCKLFNVLAQGFGKYGFHVRNNSFLCELTGCVSANNNRAGFYFENLAGNGRGGEYVPNLVSNCISYGDYIGFETHSTIVLNIVGCIVYQSIDNGYYFHNSSNSIMVSGSRTFQAGGNAIEVDDSDEINISGNIFCWHRGHGVVFNNVRWGSCTANNFIDNGVRAIDGSLMNGIVIRDCKGLQVSGNAVFNWGDQLPMKYGIIEDEKSENNIISNNNINYFTEKGIDSRGSGTVITGNVTEGPNAYVGMDRKEKYADFNLDKIMEFIKD